MEPYLNVNDVAQLVQLSVQTIRRYTMRKEIPFHKINRAVRYKKTEIELWVEKREAAALNQCKETENGLFPAAQKKELV